MFMRFATFILWLAGVSMSHHAAAADDLTGETTVVHTLSLHVSVGGEEVMAPVFQMTSAASAELFIGSSELDGYTLVVDMLEPADAGISNGAAAQFVLWRGLAEKGVRLLDQVMVLGEKRKRKAGENVLRSAGVGQPVVLTVVSHAMQTVAGEAPSPRTSCPGKGNVAFGIGAATARADANCCSTKCGDGSGHTLKCCNVQGGCCQCGACCSIP